MEQSIYERFKLLTKLKKPMYTHAFSYIKSIAETFQERGIKIEFP